MNPPTPPEPELKQGIIRILYQPGRIALMFPEPITSFGMSLQQAKELAKEILEVIPLAKTKPTPHSRRGRAKAAKRR